MRRPQSLLGLLITAARIYAARLGAARFAGVAALVVVVAAAGIASRGARCRLCAAASPARSAVRTLGGPLAHSDAGRAVLRRTGVCAGSGQRCDDANTCESGARCVMRVSPVRRTSPRRDEASSIAWQPQLAWDGAGYGAAWLQADGDLAHAYFARLNARGERVGAPVALSLPGDFALSVSVAWSGREYGVVVDALIEEPGGEFSVGAMFARIDRDGALIGARRRLSGAGEFPLLARVLWSGREWASAWFVVGDAIEIDLGFARVAADGEPVGGPRALGHPTLATGAFALERDGDGYALAWTAYDVRGDASGLRVLRVGPDGGARGVVQVSRTRFVDGACAAARAENAVALAWEQDIGDQPNELAFAIIGSSGVTQPPRVIVPRAGQALEPSLAWHGAGYGVAWTDVRSNAYRVWFRALRADGAPTGDAVRLGPANRHGLMPAAVWTGSEFGVAWTETDGQTARLMFARVSREGRVLDAATQVAQW